MGWNAVYTNLPPLKTEVYYTDNINLQNHNIGLPSTIPMRVATLIPGVIGAGGRYRVGLSCISVLFFITSIDICDYSDMSRCHWTTLIWIL